MRTRWRAGRETCTEDTGCRSDHERFRRALELAGVRGYDGCIAAVSLGRDREWKGPIRAPCGNVDLRGVDCACALAQSNQARRHLQPIPQKISDENSCCNGTGNLGAAWVSRIARSCCVELITRDLKLKPDQATLPGVIEAQQQPPRVLVSWDEAMTCCYATRSSPNERPSVLFPVPS